MELEQPLASAEGCMKASALLVQELVVQHNLLIVAQLEACMMEFAGLQAVCRKESLVADM